MNGDRHYYNGISNNAVAGPSKQPESSILPPSAPAIHGADGGASTASSSSQHHPVASLPIGLFLPPPAPPPPRQHLNSSQDLLTRLDLVLAYDRYVRPAILPGNEPNLSTAGAGVTGTPGDKGKGKEVDGHMQTPSADGGLGGGQRDGGDEEGGKGEKKKNKSGYKHLIKGLPGKHSFKKDTYLTNIMSFEKKQVNIVPFDLTTQEDAFIVSPEGLKGWNINALVLESAQAREDRKKRKELKKLGKPLMQPGAVVGGQASGTVTPSRALPTPGASTPRPSGVGTPQRNVSGPRQAVSNAGTPRPGSGVPRPGSAMAQAGATPTLTSNTTTTPRPPIPRPDSAVPRPGSTVPRPGSAAGLPARPASAKPMTGGPLGGGSAGFGDGPRGKKREWDDGTTSPEQLNGPNGHGPSNGNGNGGHPPTSHPPKAIVNAKAGNGVVRPRPPKKQRLDGPNQPNSHIQQQPTPQGV